MKNKGIEAITREMHVTDDKNRRIATIKKWKIVTKLITKKTKQITSKIHKII